MKKYHAYFHTQPVLWEQMAVVYDEFVDEQTRGTTQKRSFRQRERRKEDTSAQLSLYKPVHRNFEDMQITVKKPLHTNFSRRITTIRKNDCLTNYLIG